MKTYIVNVKGCDIEIHRDDDGRFIIPRHIFGKGTNIKPSHEPIVLARKPLIGTIAANVIKYNTGALNIDACRIEYTPDNLPIPQLAQGKVNVQSKKSMYDGQSLNKSKTKAVIGGSLDGRFPANLILSHHPECKHIGITQVGTGPLGGYNYTGQKEYDVKGFIPKNKPNSASNRGSEMVDKYECHPDCPFTLFPISNSARASGNPNNPKRGSNHIASSYGQGNDKITHDYRDTGSAARFFYCAKASKFDREEGCDSLDHKTHRSGMAGVMSVDDNGKDRDRFKAVSRNHHPTVKPTDLMRYLCKLITPPNGIVLDPFMGSGSTGKAALLENFRFIGMEIDESYFNIARVRVRHSFDVAKQKIQNQRRTLFEV